MTREEFLELPRKDVPELEFALRVVDEKRTRLLRDAQRIADQLAECVEDRDLIREHIATRKREQQLVML